MGTHPENTGMGFAFRARHDGGSKDPMTTGTAKKGSGQW
jgi:hypothetical protein